MAPPPAIFGVAIALEECGRQTASVGAGEAIAIAQVVITLVASQAADVGCNDGGVNAAISPFLPMGRFNAKGRDVGVCIETGDGPRGGGVTNC